jgi:hypothetical protein
LFTTLAVLEAHPLHNPLYITVLGPGQALVLGVLDVTVLGKERYELVIPSGAGDAKRFIYTEIKTL